MHFAPHYGIDSAEFRHTESAAYPEAGFLGVRVTIVAGVESVIRLPPIRAESADRVFHEIRRACPFTDINAAAHQLERSGQCIKPLILEPARAAHSKICAGRKRHCELVFPQRGQPFEDVRAVVFDAVVNGDTRRVLEIDGHASVTRVSPWDESVWSSVTEG